MTPEQRLLITGLNAMHKALDRREPEHIDHSEGSAEWRGCRVTFKKDTPDDTGYWGIDYKDGSYIRELPKALVELLIEKHYEEVMESIDG